MKLKKVTSGRAFVDGHGWIYRTDCQPEDVDGSPEFFDDVMDDLVDRDKYFSEPLSSGVGMRFRLILGNVHKTYKFAEFLVIGVKKTMLETGVSKFGLLWKRITDWQTFDIDAEKVKAVEEKPVKNERYIKQDGSFKFNKAIMQFEVFEGDKIIAVTRDKEQAGGIANGSLPY